MADIVLAEHQGRTWLVSGEKYIDDLLANTLPADTSIEIVVCVSHADVNRLWVQDRGDQGDVSTPWFIHPGIIDRIRRVTAGHSVFFGQWSAMLDGDAQSIIRTAADRALTCGESDVVLTTYIDPDSPKMVSDLANLRQGVIEAALAALGVTGSRIVRATRDLTGVPEGGSETDRIDIIINAK
jgi:hypothetical protein